MQNPGGGDFWAEGTASECKSLEAGSGLAHSSRGKEASEAGCTSEGECGLK